MFVETSTIKNFTQGKVKSRLAQIETSIDRYLKQIASADRYDTQGAKDKQVRLKDKIKKLEEEIDNLNKIKAELPDIPDKQISLTDPDARSMSTSGRGKATVGYNVQSAVDTKHHIIIAHEVTNEGYDKTQLANMSKQAKEVLAVDKITAVADRGYYSGPEIKACEDANIKTYLPKPQTSGNFKKGQFTKRDFIYKPEENEYECPAGERAIYRGIRQDRGKVLKNY